MRGPDFDSLTQAGFIPTLEPISLDEIGQNIADVLSDPTRLQQLSSNEIKELQAASDRLDSEGGYHA
jgi:hypothetical protein